jgi:DNA-binding GntR family transcriptional regulator
MISLNWIQTMFISASNAIKYLEDPQSSNNSVSRSLSEKAYEQIRRLIVTLKLPPGGIVDETRLQRDLRLGRTPIREALLRLSQEKLVTIVPRRGIFVTDIMITDLQRLFEVRLELETLAVRLAARRGSEEHWERMEAVLSKWTNRTEKVDNQLLIAVDELCHLIIYEATDNKFLQDTLYINYALSLRLWYYFLGRIDEMYGALRQHQEILQALRGRNEDLAHELMEDHLHKFEEEIQAVMRGTPSPFHRSG